MSEGGKKWEDNNRKTGMSAIEAKFEEGVVGLEKG